MQRVALVVGVTQYRKLGVGNVYSFANNANAIANVLRPTFTVKCLPQESVQEGERVQVGKDFVSLKDLRDQLRNLFTADDFDTVLFYFSGHGVRDSRQDDPRTYLATSETEVLGDGYHKAIEIDLIKQFLQNCPAREQIVWLDCCYGGDLVKFAKDLNDDKIRFIITASRSEDHAYEEIPGEMGVFTRALLEALTRTGAVERIITCAAIEAAVREKLRTLPYPQMPQFYRTPNRTIEFWDRRVMTQKNQYSSAASNDDVVNSQTGLHNVSAGRDIHLRLIQIINGTRSNSNNVDSQEDATQKSHSGNQFNPKKFIDRPQFEEILWRFIQKEMQEPFTGVLISASQKMGKTWLVEKVIRRARDSKYKAVQYSCGREIFVNSNEFFNSLYKSIARQLDIYLDNEYLVNIQDHFMTNYVLPNSQNRLVIALDNFDYLSRNPEFNLICLKFREWIENGGRSHNWARLRLIFVIANQRLPEIARGIPSPLENVGLFRMYLKKFTNGEVKQLLDSYNLGTLQEDNFKKIMEFVNNHPDLINSVLIYLSDQWKHKNQDELIEQVLEKGCKLEGVIFKEHLEMLRRRMQDFGVVDAYEKVLRNQGISHDDRLKLEALGLIEYSDNSIKPSCLLYSKYFSENL